MKQETASVKNGMVFLGNQNYWNRKWLGGYTTTLKAARINPIHYVNQRC